MSVVPTVRARVLIVDDEPDLREVVGTRLRAAGYEVAEASSGPEALAAIDGGTYDVVVLDVMMPALSGLQVLERLRLDEQAPAVIVLSARSDLETRIESLSLGAVDYLAKPFEAAELLARIAVAVRTRSQLIKAISVSLEDQLTGLGNRRAFDQVLEQEVARALRHKRTLSLIMLDADGLKRVNDRLGHAAGDAMLQQIARAIRRTLRISDHAARIGGDEFAVILPETPRSSADVVVRRIREALATERVSGNVAPAASMGVASLPDDAVDAAGLVSRADAELYRTKLDRGSVRPSED